MLGGPEHWDKDSEIGVDCLLPNGIFVTMICRKSNRISDIKQQLWAEAKRQPLFHLLRDPESYVFVYVTTRSKQVECVEESQRLNEIRPYKPIFKVVQREGDRTLSLLNSQIGEVIGKTISELASVKSSEVNDFRLSMIERCHAAIAWRNSASWEELMRCYCPPDVVSEQHVDKLLENLRKMDAEMVQLGQFLIQVQLPSVKSASGKEQAQGYKFQFKTDLTPKSLISLALGKKAKTVGSTTKEDAEDYILKVIGMDEYLFEDLPLLRYRYIKDRFQQQKTPLLTLVNKKHVPLGIENETFVQPHVAKSTRSSAGSCSLWEMKESFSFKVSHASNLHIDKDVSVMVLAGIYHGEECYQILRTGPTQQQGEGTGARWVWNENLVCDQIDTRDIPPGARLCVAIYTIYDDKSKKKKRKGRENKVALAWGNIALIDYRRQLLAGTYNLYCWLVEDSLDDDLNFLGTVQPNPNTSDSPHLCLEFVDIKVPVHYPSTEEFLAKFGTQVTDGPPKTPSNRQLMEQWKDIVEKDPLAEVFETDKEFLWNYRDFCFRDYPEVLPKLLSAVKWNEPAAVAEMYDMLKRWKPLDPEAALELLDYKFQDPVVRTFAVNCLKTMSDEQLSRYLLQLVQAVKYESYLNCDLAWFLLDRAWKNIRIGHYMFWHLRAEMDNPQVSLRFGLLLEAYCRGSTFHIKSMERQVKALHKLKAVSEMLRKNPDKKDKLRSHLRQLLSLEPSQVVLSSVESILNPRVKLGTLQVDQCKVFDSKMKPLLLTYHNLDKGEEKLLKVIFKHGDDLRQDMLTLQIISIMDQLWQQEGLDLRMLPYGCLATGEKTGFIEVVQDSETIANIQKLRKKGKGLWDSHLLLDWLKERNPDSTQWNRAGDNFCRSCAGYCVATYVLGIGDRHSDNVMVTKDGQLFHIDYGHFLGNFKSKFGVKREFVPFVLADDFTLIIEKHIGFQAFAALCEEAYITLRRKGNLFITLFAMMLQTGIPELRSVDDLNYMKVALALHRKETEAREYFKSKLQEARRKAWTISMNWYVHGLAKDNSKI